MSFRSPTFKLNNHNYSTYSQYLESNNYKIKASTMSDSDDDPLVTKPFKFVTGEYFAVKLATFSGLTSNQHLAGKSV